MDKYMQERLKRRQWLANVPFKFMGARSDRDVGPLYFCGSRGVGKTHEMCGIINSQLLSELDKTDGYMKFAFLSVPELLDAIRQSFNKADGESDPKNLLRYNHSIDIYCLDDLGSERPTEWVQERLFMLINRIYETHTGLMITSNLTLDELASSLGDRISSRLAEMCAIVDMGDEDRRVR